MRNRLTGALAIGATLLVVCAGIAIGSPTKTIVGNIELIADGHFTPKALPKNELAPIRLTVSGKINTLDGSHLPPLQQVIVEADKNGTINAKGLPTCTVGKLAATTTRIAEQHCKSSIVGAGETNVEVKFPEQPAFIAKSKLLAFNGGVKGGTTTILIHAFLESPVSAAVITTVKVSKIHNGPYGTKSIATIPVIAGGNGSVKEFELSIFRTFTYKGKKQSYLLAKCPTGRLRAHAEAVFLGGTKLSANFTKACTPKG